MTCDHEKNDCSISFACVWKIDNTICPFWFQIVEIMMKMTKNIV